MKAIALARIDPTIVGSLMAACLALIALGTSRTVLRLARLLLETLWLYLSNTRG
jgi:hypothetical protein